MYYSMHCSMRAKTHFCVFLTHTSFCMHINIHVCMYSYKLCTCKKVSSIFIVVVSICWSFLNIFILFSSLEFFLCFGDDQIYRVVIPPWTWLLQEGIRMWCLFFWLLERRWMETLPWVALLVVVKMRQCPFSWQRGRILKSETRLGTVSIVPETALYYVPAEFWSTTVCVANVRRFHIVIYTDF